MTCARTPGGARGASIVEFAVLAPVMLLIVMGVVDLARGYQMQIRLENAAREGAAYAQLHPARVSCGPDTDITDRAGIEEAGVDSTPGYRVEVFAVDENGDLTEVLGCDESVDVGGERVLVEVSATFGVMTPLVAQAVGGSIEIVGSAEIEMQR